MFHKCLKIGRHDPDGVADAEMRQFAPVDQGVDRGGRHGQASCHLAHGQEVARAPSHRTQPPNPCRSLAGDGRGKAPIRPKSPQTSLARIPNSPKSFRRFYRCCRI